MMQRRAFSLPVPLPRRTCTCILWIASLLPTPLTAQTAAVTGSVRDAGTGAVVPDASVRVEGTERQAFSDSAGVYRIARVPAGPQVLVVERIGYATARVPVTVPAAGVVARDVELATSALAVPGVTVTADAVGRAEGELGTASVIERSAIEVQNAASLAGLLELVPGVELQPPGLGGVQQIPLRSVPTSSTSSVFAGGPSAADVASSGTLILLDGVPLSNNANLQSLGPRGELPVLSSAGGGIDLRRIPAATLERVEVIRGVPSARYGDLTQGAIVVETRAGAFEPRARGLFDAHTGGATFLGGWPVRADGALTANVDLTRSRLEPGVNDNTSYRFSTQLVHRAEAGAVTLDSHVDLFQVYQENPEDPEVAPGASSSARDRGVRVSERLRWAAAPDTRVEATAALDFTRQRSVVEALRARGAMPFTDRLEEGRAVGRYIGGEYASRLELDGRVWQLYGRVEGQRDAGWLGFQHRARTGLELRREWNGGAGYQFDIEFPPQVSFNGVQGFDRPRSFDAVPPLTTSALYLDDRMLRALPGGMTLDLQVGLRLDLLHEGGSWVSGVRDAVLQPRFNAQLSPRPWLRLRGGVGRTAKQPTLARLHPAPQYFDVVNVNYFTDDPAERLAVLTTFIRDPTNPDLGFARTTKLEGGVELATAGGEASLGIVAFRDRTEGAVGFRSEPGFLPRDRYQLTDSVLGNGVRPDIVEPAFRVDSILVPVDVPANNLTLETSGWEVTARLPELPVIRTRLEVQGAWIRTELEKDGLDFGLTFSQFQLDERQPRAPYWSAVTETGERGLATWRLIHHQPSLGLVLTGTLQHVFHEERQNLGGTDTLAWEGYVTRGGRLVPVPAAERTRPEFEDLRRPRINTFVERTRVAPDWLLSVQASLDLPRGGRLSFYAFNALDRPGAVGDEERQARFHPPLRFGLEGSVPLGPLFGAVGDLASGER